jgi:DNA mismatch repair protein MutH
MFWQMNNHDLELVYKFWALTRDNVCRGDYSNFITIRNNFICHVRTKGINNKDLMKTPQGTMELKRGYWLNASYIKSQI